MSAQRSTQLATSQTGSGSSSRGQQRGLTRPSAMSSLPSLLIDPLGFFDDDPVSLIRRMQREMNRVFSQAGVAPSGRSDDITSAAWVPTTEISYADGNLVISVDLPGLDDEDVTVEINDDVLVVRGERKVERDESEGGIRRTERQYGEFYRAIALPDGADAENARAEFDNGVLRITIPVAEEKGNLRQIPIEASTASSQSTQQSGTQQQGKPAEQKQGSTSATGEQKAA